MEIHLEIITNLLLSNIPVMKDNQVTIEWNPYFQNRSEAVFQWVTVIPTNTLLCIINSHNRTGQTLLYLAAYMHNKETLKLLLDAQGSLNQLNADGSNVLHGAIYGCRDRGITINTMSEFFNFLIVERSRRCRTSGIFETNQAGESFCMLIKN